MRFRLKVKSLSAELLLHRQHFLVCFVRTWRPLLGASGSHFAVDLAKGEGIGRSLAGSVRFSTSTHHRNRFYGPTQTDSAWLCCSMPACPAARVDRCPHRSGHPCGPHATVSRLLAGAAHPAAPVLPSEVSLRREDESESPEETLVVLDKTDREPVQSGCSSTAARKKRGGTLDSPTAPEEIPCRDVHLAPCFSVCDA